MKLTINRKPLAHALKTVVGATKNRTTLPILNHVLMTAKGGKISFSASDLDMFITAEIDCDAKAIGAICLPCEKFLAIANSSTTESIEISTNLKHQCTLIGADFNCMLNGMDAGDFPPIPALENAKSFTMKSETLSHNIRMTSFAASNDASRHNLNSVCLASRNGTMNTVSTDGRRIALVEDDTDADGEFDIILPSKMAETLGRIVIEDCVVLISHSERHSRYEMTGKSQSVSFVSKQIEGNYPNFRNVIPNDAKFTVKIQRSEILSAVQRASLFTDEMSSSIKLELDRNSLAIVSQSSKVGNGRVSIVTNGGQKMEIAFNPGYLTDVLSTIPEDEIDLLFLDYLSPMVIRSKNFTYVVMPQRLN